MLRLAEFTFNSRNDVDFDVLLGTRELPQMDKETQTWNLNRIICDEMKLGFMVMLAGTHIHNFAVYQSIADTMKVPLIDWELSHVRLGAASKSPMTFSVRPPVDQLIIDYIKYKGWNRIVYIHDGANSERTLHGMFEYLYKKHPDYELFVDSYKAPSDEEFFRDFLNSFHRRVALQHKIKSNNSEEENEGMRSFTRHQLFNKGKPGVYCRPYEDSNGFRPFEPFEHGDKIADAMRQRFQWAEGEGFLFGKNRIFHEKKPNKTSTKKGILPEKPWKLRFNIVTVLVKPFVMLKKVAPGEPELTGNARFEGYCVDLLEKLAKNITGFEYDIFVSFENRYGARQPDGSWDGMIGYLLNETADVAVAPLSITQERERAVDFSKPFMTTGISIMIKKPEKQEFNIFSFLEPLETNIWMYTILSYVCISFTIFVVSSLSYYEKRLEFSRGEFRVTNEFSLYNSLWFTALSGRIASACWWFFTLIIVSSYTANLAAFLTLERMTPPVESVEDLANQDKILYGVVKGGSSAAFFEDSTVPLYKKMWNFMVNTHNRQLSERRTDNSTGTIFVDTYAEGIEKVRKSKGRYAFLLEETTNNYESGRKPCDTMKVGQNLNTLGYGIATKFGNPLRASINLAILYLSEKGELKKLESKWWMDRTQCEHGITTDSSQSPSLNLSKVAGIFYFLLAGMCLSLFTALSEFIIRKKREKKEKKKITRRKAIKKNIDDIRERKVEIAKVIKGLSEEDTPNASPDQQAQQAELDKDIEELKATLLEFKNVAEQAVAASTLNEKLVEKLQLHKKKKATMMEVRKQKASDLDAKAKKTREELNERIDKLAHEKEMTKKKQRQLEDLRKEALRIGIQLTPEDEKSRIAAINEAEKLISDTDRIPPLENSKDNKSEEKPSLDEEDKEKKRQQIRENVRIERERQSEVNRVIREKLAAMEERKKRIQEIRKILEEGDKSQEVLASANAALQEEQTRIMREVSKFGKETQENDKETNGKPQDSPKEDVPPPLPTVPPPDDAEDSLDLHVPPIDLEYTLINAKRNLENLTAMRERLEKMQEAGEDIDDEQAAIIEQLEDLNSEKSADAKITVIKEKLSGRNGWCNNEGAELVKAEEEVRRSFAAAFGDLNSKNWRNSDADTNSEQLDRIEELLIEQSRKMDKQKTLFPLSVCSPFPSLPSPFRSHFPTTYTQLWLVLLPDRSRTSSPIDHQTEPQPLPSIILPPTQPPTSSSLVSWISDRFRTTLPHALDTLSDRLIRLSRGESVSDLEPILQRILYPLSSNGEDSSASSLSSAEDHQIETASSLNSSNFVSVIANPQVVFFDPI
ncbi:hypothetical protein WR25_19520 [Diploscapter pachys]|uniref:Ionotropic glutamate receptor L-glutamate and glycine-binding domain-containing protein n=1 Tax=Diploscapter pachys TaxID=2018661 RepID=A0A2A2LR44_9BILA|nr:hypothetical protein WR25_19520 [Diploscapter pachys]